MFSIPKEDVEAVAMIKTLSDASVKELIAALDSAKVAVDTDKLAEGIYGRVPSIPMDDLRLILEALYALYFVRELAGVQSSRFLSDFMDGLQGEKKLAFQKKDEPKVRLRFEKLLNIDVLNVMSKAAGLQRDGERLYCSAKIISDIRPVFGPKATVR